MKIQTNILDAINYCTAEKKNAFKRIKGDGHPTKPKESLLWLTP